MRSASATVRCARCSTSRTVTPRSRIAASAANTASTIPGESPSDGSSRRSTPRSRHERAPDRELLLLAAGERAGRPAARLREHRKELVDLRERLAGVVPAPCREPEPKVLLHREVAEDPPSLRHERDAGTGDRLRTPATERGAGEPHVAACRRHDAHDRVQRRRLAGAVRADQTDELALCDAEGQVSDRADRSVAHLEPVELEHRVSHP